MELESPHPSFKDKIILNGAYARNELITLCPHQAGIITLTVLAWLCGRDRTGYELFSSVSELVG